MRRRSPSSQRWPLVAAGHPEERRASLRALLLASGVALLGGAGALPGLPIAARALLGAIGLGLLGAALRRRAHAVPPSEVAVVADDAGLSRVSPDGARPLVRWGAPFGITLLASYGRPHALLAFTTPSHTRYVPARIDHRSEADDELLARVALLADLDFVDGASHEAALSPEDAAAIVRRAEAHDRRALGRVLLSDGRGEPIALERSMISVGDRSFDLGSHLEWRALMFHESTGQSAALYQATWIRQNGAEVVFIAPMPASLLPRGASAAREEATQIGRTLRRDVRLLQCPTEPPPPRDVRVAIDRPFMLAVRRALDAAPLASRAHAPASRGPRPAGRDSTA